MQTPLTKTYSAGEWIFHEGDSGECAYLIEDGEVVIVLERDDEWVPLGVYGKGALFGEMAIIDDQPRSAGAIVQKKCRLRMITRSQINHRIEQADPILKVCISVLLGHLRKTLSNLNSGSVLTPPAEEDTSNLPLPERLQRATDEALLSGSTGGHIDAYRMKMNLQEQKSKEGILFQNVPSVAPLLPETFHEAIQTLNIEHALSIAVDDGQLCLFYQPIMEVHTGRVAGFEALMRWIHPERGLISPGEFIPIAERSGQIVEMTYWAVNVACRDLVKIRNQLLGHIDLAPHVSETLFMSVNFSARDFLSETLMDHVNELLTQYQLPKDSVKIEITESVLVNSPVAVQQALDRCKANGASIAIDDFGTGYSSLSYLQSMPADTLKIDQGFIRPMHQDERHMALLESIIHLAQRLDMKTVAEGVETSDDVESLTLLNCDYLQGYYFARPMPLVDILSWAERHWGQESNDFLG
jgi:diguanylate cyclase